MVWSQSSLPGAYSLSRRLAAMLPDAHFLPRVEAECLRTWRPDKVGVSGESPSQITSWEYVCSGQAWLPRRTLQASWAPCQACPQPFLQHLGSSWAAQCPNRNSSDASREADLIDWPPDPCLHLPEATNSHPAPLPEQPLGPPSPLTPVPTLIHHQAPRWLSI